MPDSLLRRDSPRPVRAVSTGAWDVVVDNHGVAEWRVELLDEAEPGPPVPGDVRRLAFVIVTFMALSLLLGVVAARSPITKPDLARSTLPAAASMPASTLNTMLALDAHELPAGTCGGLSAAVPAPIYGDNPVAVRRGDASVSVRMDPWWVWCVAGVRVYETRFEIVGQFVPIREATGGPNPRMALRSAELEVTLGNVVLGPAAIGDDGVLRVWPDYYVRPSPFAAGAAQTSALTLRIVSLDATWAVARTAATDDPGFRTAALDTAGRIERVYLMQSGETWARLAIVP